MSETFNKNENSPIRPGKKLFKWMGSPSLVSKVSITFITIHLITTISFTIIGYKLKVAADDSSINTRLISAVHSLPGLVGKSYLRELLTDGPFDEQRYRSMLLLLDNYVKKIGIDSTFILTQKKGRFVFAIDSANTTEYDAGFYGKHFSAYETGPIEALMSLKKNEELFSEYDDEFGEFRSLFVTVTGPDGSDIILGADVSLEIIYDSHTKCLLLFTGIGLVIFTLGLLIGLPLSRAFTNPIRSLSRATQKITDGDYEISLPVQRDELGQLSNAIMHMSDAIASRELRITQLAFKDDLTGLRNWTCFIKDAGEKLESCQKNKKHSIAIVEVFDMKLIRSMYGYNSGNLLVQKISLRLTSAIAENEIIAKITSDRFALLLESDNSDYIDNFVAALRPPFSIGRHKGIKIGARVGVARYPNHGLLVEDLLSHAQSALESAHDLERSYLFYDPEREQQRQRMIDLLQDFEVAISSGELTVFLQPKAILTDGRIESAEALVRWQHPRLGLLGPGVFLPILERCGKISELSIWLIQECMQLVQIQNEFLPIRISINLSVQDLESVDFPDRVEKLLKITGAKAKYICFEITESSAMQNPDQALQSLTRLRAIGFWLSIDDFGTGYSSLAYLSRLPVDELKIDRSFITHLHRPEQQAIVRTIVQLGLILKLRLVAEGAERSDVCMLLRSFGCQEVQGYFVAKPMPAAEFYTWLSDCGGYSQGLLAIA